MDASGQGSRQGVNELNRLIRDHRNACPDQHVKARPGVPGYIWGAHGNYNFNVDAYSDDARGQ